MTVVFSSVFGPCDMNSCCIGNNDSINCLYSSIAVVQSKHSGQAKPEMQDNVLSAQHRTCPPGTVTLTDSTPVKLENQIQVMAAAVGCDFDVHHTIQSPALRQSSIGRTTLVNHQEPKQSVKERSRLYNNQAVVYMAVLLGPKRMK